MKKNKRDYDRVTPEAASFIASNIAKINVFIKQGIKCVFQVDKEIVQKTRSQAPQNVIGKAGLDSAIELKYTQ